MMGTDDDDELETLRRRAYAPGGDIGSDPDALRRLIELEARADPTEQVPKPSSSDTAEERGEEPMTAIPDAAPAPSRSALPRPRRSTVILLAAAALVAATLATALILVQRVQTDPLQVGATQIARLAPDPDYVPPSALYRGVTSETTAYAEWQGLRFITYPSIVGGDDSARCLVVWQPDLLDIGSDGGSSYSGELFTQACGAGAFPASTAVLLRETTPERSLTEFPPDTALQFVYDRENDEIVVFRG